MNYDAAVLPAGLGLGLLAAMSLLWVGLGLFWGRGQDSLSDHMLAGRNVGFALGSATAVATWVTSNTTMLAPQFALQMGIWGMLAYSTAAIGLFLFAPLSARIRQAMPEGFTSAEFIRLRYGKGAFAVFLAISLFYAFTWLISMGIAGGLLLESLSGIPYLVGVTAILLVCTIYTVVGGMRAVIGTDFLQTCIILVGVVILGVATVQTVPLEKVYTHLERERPALLDAMLPVALMALFNNLLFGIGEIFHSNVWWSRAFAMRPGVARRAYLLAGIVWLPIPIAAGFVALAAPAMGVNVPQVNMVGPIMAGALLGKAGAILVFMVVFASIASSIDSLLAATSDLVTKEVVQTLFLRDASQQTLRRASVWVTWGLASLAWGACAFENADLGTVLFRAGPLVGSTIWPIAMGLYSRRAQPYAAVLAMVLGTASGLVAYYTLGWYTATLIGTATSMVTMAVGTALFPDAFEWRKLNPQSAHS